MSAIRSRMLLAVLTLTAATALTAVMAGPVHALPASGGGYSSPPYTGLTSTPQPTPTMSSPLPPPPSTPTPGNPGPVTGLRVTATSRSSVTLAWDPAFPGGYPIARYRINYWQAFDDVYRVKDAGDATAATITEGIVPNGQYTFYVYAYDTGGQSSNSAALTVVTPYGSSGDLTAPTQPANLTVTGVSPGGVPLSWSPSTDDVGVTGYNIYHFDGYFITSLVATSVGTSVYAPLRYSPGNNGSYYVRARDAAGNLSIFSNLVPAPQGPQPTPSTSVSPAPAPTCRFSLHIGSQWAGGFVADWTVTNTGTAAVNDWVLTFEFNGDERVVSGWSAIHTQTGSSVTLTGLAWNRTIPAGGSVSGGFVGSGTASTAPPASAALNGRACTIV